MVDQPPAADQPPPLVTSQPDVPPVKSNERPASPERTASGEKAIDDELTPAAAAGEAVADAGTAAEQFLIRGREQFNRGKYREALFEYQQVLRLDSTNQDVHYLIGLAHEQLGEYTAARQAYQQCTSGPYAVIAQNHVKSLEKKTGHSK
jgi:tetratricopeptide (TPR) repeat protein